MHRWLLPLYAALLLAGQGCFSPATTIPLTEIDPLGGQATPDGTVTFQNGFGKLPGKPPTSSRPPVTQPSFVLNAELPPLPPDVTVLREWDTAPTATLLRNITTAVDVPSGAIGNGATSDALSLSWQDGQGYDWTYGAPAHTLTATWTRSTPPARTGLGVEELTQQAQQAAESFLSTRGINMAGWGGADISLQPSQAWRVAYAASRDVQPISGGDGVFLSAGEIKGTGGLVTSATVELPRNLDRSNYPALTPDQVLQRLRAGGTNPVLQPENGSTVSIDSFSIILYRFEGISGNGPRVFYVPSVLALGQYRSGSASYPYTTLVPLATDASFTEKP